MYHVAIKMVGNKDIASDIVQEVFIYLFDKINNGKPVIYISSWLYKATLNKCIDNHRIQKRFKPIESANHLIIDDETVDLPVSSEFLIKALSGLKPLEKAMVILYSEGFSYKEIADTMDIKFSSIGKMLSRTLDKLEKELKPYYHEMFNK